jgi:farnesyl diphosphate synthase
MPAGGRDRNTVFGPYRRGFWPFLISQAMTIIETNLDLRAAERSSIVLDAIDPACGLGAAMRRLAVEIDELYEETLAIPSDRRDRLYKAMRYAAVGGGKRLRPLLVVASGDLFGVPRKQTVSAGLAVECVHVQSLIHDDLPCMDDDDIRSGKPALHRAFDEATAVLAGDALLVLAFEILAAPRTYPDPEVRTELIAKLAQAAGAPGMAGGQMLDILAQSGGVDVAAVTELQGLKTGALFGWCVEAGAIMGRAPQQLRAELRGYAHCLGLAFQIADDLLDPGDRNPFLGKRIGKYGVQQKATLDSLLGRDRARRQAERLVEQAIDHLESFGQEAELLHEIIRFAVARVH